MKAPQGKRNPPRRRIAIAAAIFLTLCAVGTYRFRPEIYFGLFRCIERARAGLRGATIRVDGDEIAYLMAGDPARPGSSPPIVMIHGFGGDKDNWTRFACHLPAAVLIVAPDLPGFGDSSKNPDQHYDVTSQAERLTHFLDALGLRTPVHLVGNSMGGHIAVKLTLLHPERVASLGLFAPGGVQSPVRSDAEVLREHGKEPLLVSSRGDFDRFLSLVFEEPPFIPRPVRRYFGEKAAEARPFNAKIWADVHQSSAPIAPQLAEIGVSALILWGDNDRVLHVSGADLFARGLRHSATVIMKHCGHLPMIERPEETAAHYLQFLANPPPSR
ncbi:MAG: alpha/beta fold hydrolase [Candidatus Schekmanbacteria bacterium]|nr:alpha/beta fold hydrolase [Candidatus Schekmanbacteria bacterium]